MKNNADLLHRCLVCSLFLNLANALFELLPARTALYARAGPQWRAKQSPAMTTSVRESIPQPILGPEAPPDSSR